MRWQWTRQVKAERAAALARDASQTRRQASRQLTQDDNRTLITSLGNLRDVIRAADPAVKTTIYSQLGLKVTYLPGQDKLRADVTISPEKFLEQPDEYGVMGRVRGANAAKTNVSCLVSSQLGAGRQGGAGPVNPLDDNRLRGAAGADCMNGFLPAHAPAAGDARAVGPGRGADSPVGGRHDRGCLYSMD
jgi:hypothetical protein